MAYREPYTLRDDRARRGESGNVRVRSGAQASYASSRPSSRGSRSAAPVRVVHPANGRSASFSTEGRLQTNRQAPERNRVRTRMSAIDTKPSNEPAPEQRGRKSKQTLFSRASKAAHDARRAKEKKRAQRLSGRQFADTGASDASAGPRAALYKGEMGKSHRRSQNLMSGGVETTGSFRPISVSAGAQAPHAERKRIAHPFLVGTTAVCLTVLLAFGFMFGTVQSNYKTMREHDRIEAEYEAVVERNNDLQNSIDSLSTDSGVEAYAHEEYGWVMAGEESGTVQGLESGDTDLASSVNTAIQPGSIKAPETWYSKYLDPLFGVE